MRASMAFALVLFFPAISYAESGPDICKSALDKYNRTMNSMALHQAVIIADDSIPRSTDKKIEILNDMIAAQINVQLLIANKCPLPTMAADPDPNPEASIVCATALIHQRTETITSGEAPTKTPPECEKLKAK